MSTKNKENKKEYYRVSEADGGLYEVKVKAVKPTLEPDGTRIFKYMSIKDSKNMVDKLDADGNVVGYKVETKKQLEERLFVHLYNNATSDGLVIVKYNA